MTTTDRDLQEQIEGVVRELIRDKGHRVYEWPEDEAAAYRDNGGFTKGNAAVEDLRVAKGVAAVLPIVKAAQDRAWDDCADEARDLGWIHAPAHGVLIDRNPYREETPDGH